MFCPNCAQEMQSRVYDYQYILHCSNCGASFFEENGINRITLETAKKLDEEKNGNFILGNHKLCPKDDNPLVMLTNDEAIPQNVSLFRCNQCNGIFGYPEDLVKFKEAQKAKIEFFRVWQMPLPSLKSVMVMGIMAVVTVSLFTSFISYNLKQTTSSQASDIIKNIYISQSDRYVFISFKTSQKYKSKITFYNTTTNQSFTKNISEILTDVHSITTTAVNLNGTIDYQIILIKENGQEIQLEKHKLEEK
ncbi:MAG: zf-TFIIB domain-containing protein [Candidatus Roizmanbacteria bacterium]